MPIERNISPTRTTPERDLSELRNGAMNSVRSTFEVAVRSHLGLSLRKVQADAAAALLGRCVVEMHTGEGKTLTSALAAAAFVAAGHKVLVATANEYLAERDAQWMRPIFADLSFSCEALVSPRQSGMSSHENTSYLTDVTYGTIRQFGFDFLRSGIAERQARREHPSAEAANGGVFPFDVLIVDEADSVLIDEARMPLIITAPSNSLTPAIEATLRWAASIARSMSPGRDFMPSDTSKSVALTTESRKRVLRAEMPPAMNSLSTTEILHAVERALSVQYWFQRDHHYVVRSGRIDLVDEYTGRSSQQRRMSSGLHQALEAREDVELTPPSTTIARITIQDFVSKFGHVCGLTATAHEDRREFRDVYRLTVHRLPTHQPVRRTSLPTIVCHQRTDKWHRIAKEVTTIIGDQRAVLIGTRTIEQSQSLSGVLSSHGIAHNVLNALNPEEESRIIAGAGQVGQVTVATNMAGRGTDIPLSDQVRSRGGLHVIVSELHAARRIDRQLMGRCARQGDPGTTRLYVAADDELTELAFGSLVAQEIKTKHARGRSDAWLLRKLIRAQRHLSTRHRQQRWQLTNRESHLAEAMRTIGLNPHFDPIPDDYV